MPTETREVYRTKLIDAMLVLMSPTFDPSVRSMCRCTGCSPFTTDDGRRPRTITVKDNTSAYVGNERRRQRVVWSAYEPAESST
jgi:hypothetical protein